jgi:hypothetical protein
MDAVFLPSPYAFAFGGFVERVSVYWWAIGGVVASLYELAEARFFRPASKAVEGELPSDMSTMSLVGGGLIAGDALAALAVALFGLVQAM